MLDLEKIQELIKPQYEEDRSKKSIEVTAASLDEALADAAVQLETPLHRVDYEILERGSSGLLSFGKKDWRIRAYTVTEIQKSTAAKKTVAAVEVEEEEARVEEKRDGEAFIHFSNDGGVYLKVVAPVGAGEPVSLRGATADLQYRGVKRFDGDQVRAIVNEQAGEYVRIGDYEHKSANDALLSVEVSDDEMKGWIIVSPPGDGGAEVSADTIFTMLKYQSVVDCILEDAVRQFQDKPVYKERYLVAEGLPAKNGADAYIDYNFETDQTKIRLKETTSGKVDFKELNLIQNVVEGQLLARKIPAERGRGGKTVTGKYLETKNGRDVPLPVGKNVRVAEDGVSILAETNGQVVLFNNKINVEPILSIAGDVCLRTGNIIFLGTVVIAGNVQDGFSVKASGNIEVHGTVGKADLDAEGDIVVNQGITGRNEGKIHAGRSLWARFIENAFVSVGEFVIVSDGIIKSQVNAKKKILCQGKRAAIVGGNLRASEEIHAKTLGSAGGGGETVLEVGFDPDEKARLDTLLAKQVETQKQFDEVDLNLQTLINLKKQRKTLPEDKEETLKKLSEKRQLIQYELSETTREAESIQEYLNGLKTRGRVHASDKVYAGVVIIIRDVKEVVRNDCKATTFCLEAGLVRYGKYEGADEDMKRVPDGYTSN